MNIEKVDGEVFKNGSVESDTRNLPAYVLGYEAGEANMQQEDVYTIEKMEEDAAQVGEEGLGDSLLIGDLFTKALMLTPLFESNTIAGILNMSFLTQREKPKAKKYTRHYLSQLPSDTDILPKFCNVLKAVFLNVGADIVNIIKGKKDFPTKTHQHDENISNISGYCSKFLDDVKELQKEKGVTVTQILELETSFYKLISENLDKAYKEYLDNHDNMNTTKLYTLELYTKLNETQKKMRFEKMNLLKNTVDLVKSVAVMSLDAFSSGGLHPMKQLINEISEVKKVFEQHEIFGTTPRCLTQFKYFDEPLPSGQ